MLLSLNIYTYLYAYTVAGKTSKQPTQIQKPILATHTFMPSIHVITIGARYGNMRCIYSIEEQLCSANAFTQAIVSTRYIEVPPVAQQYQHVRVSLQNPKQNCYGPLYPPPSL